MSFATTVTDTIDLADGQTVTVRKLGWKALKAARDAKQREAIQVQKDLGADFQMQMRKAIAEQGGIEELRKLADADPFLTHDQATLLERGIVSWTYPQPVTPEIIADLDEGTAELVARRVFDLSRGKTEAERKNS